MGNRIRDIQRLQQQLDQPGYRECRIADRVAGEKAHADAVEKFGTITAENFQEACDYQAIRRKLHEAQEIKAVLHPRTADGADCPCLRCVNLRQHLILGAR